MDKSDIKILLEYIIENSRRFIPKNKTPDRNKINLYSFEENYPVTLGINIGDLLFRYKYSDEEIADTLRKLNMDMWCYHNRLCVKEINKLTYMKKLLYNKTK